MNLEKFRKYFEENPSDNQEEKLKSLNDRTMKDKKITKENLEKISKLEKWGAKKIKEIWRS